MECFNVVMPVIIYLLLSILIIVLIILGLKLLKTVEKVNNMLDDVNNKMSSFDGILGFIETTGDYISAFGEKTMSFLYDKFNKIFNKKKGESDHE